MSTEYYLFGKQALGKHAMLHPTNFIDESAYTETIGKERFWKDATHGHIFGAHPLMKTITESLEASMIHLLYFEYFFCYRRIELIFALIGVYGNWNDIDELWNT